MQEHDPGSTHFNSPTLLEWIRMSATVKQRCQHMVATDRWRSMGRGCCEPLLVEVGGDHSPQDIRNFSSIKRFQKLKQQPGIQSRYKLGSSQNNFDKPKPMLEDRFTVSIDITSKSIRKILPLPYLNLLLPPGG
jgi:hypothetical protein